MAYLINRTDGTLLTTIADGTIDTTTNLTLTGKNYSGYGEILGENFVKLLENFRNTTAPNKPIEGQLWFDSTNKVLKVYSGSAFKIAPAVTSQASAPTNPIAGDLWYDSTNGQLRVYTGASFALIGPSYTSISGTTGQVVETVSDGVSNHTVTKEYIGGTLVSIISKDTAFAPSPAITGFPTIYPGITVSSSVTNAKLYGTATNSDALSNLSSSQFIRADIAGNGFSLTLSSDNGLSLSTKGKISNSGNTFVVENQTNDGNIQINAKTGGVTSTRIFVDATNSRVGFGTTTPTTAVQVVGTVTATAFAGNLTGNVTGAGVNTLGTANITTATITTGTVTNFTASTTAIVPAPTLATHASTKGYVDTQISGLSGTYLTLAGGTMAGALNMGTNSITNANAIGSATITTSGNVTVGGSLSVTGAVTVSGTSLRIPSYTVAALPSAATAAQIVYVSNESGGAVLAFSDGTNWRRVTDRAIVS